MNLSRKRFRAWVDIVTQLSDCILVVLMTRSTWIYAVKMKLSGEVTQVLWMPVGIDVFIIKGIQEDVPMSIIFRGVISFPISILVCI